MNSIEENLETFGFAEVLVVINETHAEEEGLVLSKLERGVARASVPVAGSRNRKVFTSVVSDVQSKFITPQSGQDSSLAAEATPSLSEPNIPKGRLFPNLGVMLGTVDKEGLQSLRADSRVSQVTAPPILSLIRPTSTKSAGSSGKMTWGIRRLKAHKLWDLGLTGQGVLVGHLDTGADGKHPALREAITKFAEFDSLGFEISPAPEAFDSGDHGTHTAGTIAGRAVNGKHIGVAPGAELACGLVIEGGNAVARVLAGMDWAVGQNVRILNMSLGFRGYRSDFETITRILRLRNVLPVFAVGNEGVATSRSPGNYSDVISVGASNRGNEVANFSSSQLFNRPDDPIVPDIVAPGVSVVSAKPGGGLQSMNGSSMATPHIAGLAALLLEARPSSTSEEIEQAILQSCQLPPTMTGSRANRGFPDAVKALEFLKHLPQLGVT